MKKRADKKICAALVVNTFFALKQIGLCLIFCAVFHTHAHEACRETVVVKTIEFDTCCIHCDHTGGGHKQIDDRSEAEIPEKELNLYPIDSSGLSPAKQYGCRTAESNCKTDSRTYFPDCGHLKNYVVMRC